MVNAEKLPFETGEFDLVLCLEVLEHAEKPWLLAKEIERVVKSNGYILVSSQQNFPIHTHPSDYFRYTPFGLSSLFNKLKSKIVFTIDIPFGNKVKLNPEHVVLIGRKTANKNWVKGVKRFLKINEKQISVHKPYRHRLLRMYQLIREIFWETGNH